MKDFFGQVAKMVDASWENQEVEEVRFLLMFMDANAGSIPDCYHNEVDGTFRP